MDFDGFVGLLTATEMQELHPASPDLPRVEALPTAERWTP